MGVVTLLVLTCAVMTSTSSSFSAVTANPGNAFASAASFCGAGYTPSWMTGFEHGVVYASSGTGMLDSVGATSGSALTADTAVTRSGAFSLKLVKANGGDGYARLPYLGTPNVVVMRTAIRFQTLPSSAPASIVLLQGTAGGSATLTYNTGSQKLSVNIGGTSVLSSTTISAGRWYVVDLRATFNTNPRTLDWRLDGAAQTQATKSVTASTSNGIVQLGEFSSTTAYTQWYDDLAVTTTSGDYPLPDGRVRALVPDSVASSSSSTTLKDDAGTGVTAGGSLFSRLDESPMSSTGDFMKQVANGSTAYAELSMTDVASSGCVDAVSGVVAYHSSNATGASGKTSFMESGTERVVYSGTMNPGATQAYVAGVLSPATGNWTAAKLTAMTARIGFSPTATSSNYAAWDGVRIEYEQLPDPDNDYADTVLADSPAGYWRLGEASGTTATAASGSPNGTYANGPLLGMGGAVNDSDTAPWFDGTDDYAGFGNNYGFTGTSSFSVELWVETTAATSGYRRILSKQAASGGGWALLLASTAQAMPNQLTFYRQDASAADYADSGVALEPNVVYHVVATYDGSKIRLYVDGSLAVTANSTRSVPSNAANMQAGAPPWAGVDCLTGMIDEVAVYNSVLSAPRVQAHYDAGKS
jgi:hypothetical protein